MDIGIYSILDHGPAEDTELWWDYELDIDINLEDSSWPLRFSEWLDLQGRALGPELIFCNITEGSNFCHLANTKKKAGSWGHSANYELKVKQDILLDSKTAKRYHSKRYSRWQH